MVGIQKGFGVLMIVVAVAVGFGWDRRFQAAVLAKFPSYGTGLMALEDTDTVREALSTTFDSGSMGSGNEPFEEGKLGDYGPAPAIVTEGPRINTGGTPLNMDDLAGKVVLLDFWTYSCVNCLRTLPYLSAWYEEYHDQGLEIIGVHTPEFAARTPETYLGYGRAEAFANEGGLQTDATTEYTPTARLRNGEWTLEGTWRVAREWIAPTDSGTLELRFNVRDGVLVPDSSRVYQVVALEEPGDHLLRLEITGALRLFAFTFG